MPWADFSQSFPGNSLMAWVDIVNNVWGPQARMPRGTWVREFIYVPASGNLTMSRTINGNAFREDYGYTTPGYKYVWFYADGQGTHSNVFAMGGAQSNDVAITVY